MKTSTLRAAISVAALAAIPLTALSHNKGDLIIRAGAATVDPDESSSLIRAAGTGLAATSAGLNSDTQLGLTVSYMLTNNWAIEILAATPFEHEISSKGLEGFGVFTLGTVEHLPPTLSLQYFFDIAGSNFHPYAGIGLNYTLVLDEELSNDVKVGLNGTTLDVDDSVGLSVQVGFDFELDKHWMINAAIWKIDIDTEGTIGTTDANNPITVDVEIDPWVYMVSAAYKY